MSDTKAPREEVGVVVEHKTEGSTSYSGVLYASAILFDKVPPGTKLYVAAPDHGADGLNMVKRADGVASSYRGTFNDYRQK